VAFVRGRFVQSTFRVFVEKASQDVMEAVFSSDELVDWQSVCRVDLLCEEHPKCPICLDEDMVVPKVTRCGHIFCLPCIMRYFISIQDQNGKQRCPVCIESTSPEELTSVRFQMTRTLREGSSLSFLLAYRQAQSTIVRPAYIDEEETFDDEDGPEDGFQLLPSETSIGWHFSRLVRMAPGEFDALLQQELEALKQFRPAAIQAGDTELLPSIDAGVRLLGRKVEKRKADAEGAAPSKQMASRSHSGSTPVGPLWGCSYVEVLEADLPTQRASGSSQQNRSPAGAPASSSKAGVQMLQSPSLDEASSPAHSPSPSPLPSPAMEPDAPEETMHAEIMMEGAEGLDGDDEILPPPCPSASTVEPGGAPRGIRFYQAIDGRATFLEPFFQKLLLYEHSGWEHLPGGLADVRIDRLQEVTVTEEIRKRHKFLGHLPLGSQATFAHVDLRPFLSKATKEHFSEEFKKRRQQLRKEQNKARKEEREGKTRNAQEEERYYQSLNLTAPAMVQAPPTAEDFAVPLPGRAFGNEAAEGGDPGVEGEEKDEDSASQPTLAAKIKEQMSRAQKQEQDAREARQYFPALGGSASASASASSSSAPASAWGRGCGSSRAKAPANASAAASASAADAAEGEGPRVTAEVPSFGQALAGALDAASPQLAPADSSKKKKGRAGKATTIRLFG